MVCKTPRATLALCALLATLGTLVAAVEANNVIGQKNKEFTKSEVTIKPGDTLVFNNDDDVTHNVFCSDPDCKFNSNSQAPGSRYEVKFEKAGTFEVRCAIHPKMKMKVHVKP